MPRIRTVKPEFFLHEGLASLPFEGRLLAIGLLQHADGVGRMRWTPKLIEAAVFPYDDGIDMEALAQALERIDFLRRYEADGRRYALVLNFNKHQRITGKEASYESKWPEPLGEMPADSQGNIGETPGCVPGKQVGAQGTGEQGNRGTGKNNPPTPPAGGLKKKSKRRTHDGGPEALDALEHWKALQAERGTRRTIKAWPAGWGVQARIEEFGLDTVKAVITWAHKSDHKLAVNLRDGDHLTDTLFRPSKFPKYEGPALAFADNGGHTDSPSDYELPTKEDYVEFRGGNVRRSPDGTWHPSWQKLLKPAYPWREVMLRIADMTFRSREYDKHEPTPYREALMACRFPADPRPNDLQHAIDGALDEVRDDA